MYANSRSNRTERRRREGGFTLVEVMVSTVIFGFVVLGVGALYSYTLHTSVYARRATMAATLARNAIENAKNTAYANLVSQTRCYDKNLVDLGVPATTCAALSNAAIFTRQLTMTPHATYRLTEIKVLVTWQELADKKNAQLRTRRVEMISSVADPISTFI